MIAATTGRNGDRNHPARPGKSRVFDEMAGLASLGEELTRLCPAITIPAGACRPANLLPSARVFVVEDGIVLLRLVGGDGCRSLVAGRYTDGAVFAAPGAGEILQGLTDAWLTAIPQAVWTRLLHAPRAAERLVGGLEAAQRAQRQGVHALAGIRHVDRVRTQLLELAREHGRVCRDGVKLDLPLTHDLIADMVGCARETVTRSMEELERAGFIAKRGRFYQLLVPPEAISA